MSLSKLRHRYHPEHILAWKYEEEPFRCSGCKERGLGQCYKCNEYGCDFYLHEECADPDPSTFHPFMPNCNLNFHDQPPQFGERYCDACGKDIQGCVYQCGHKHRDRGPHDFHPTCLNLRQFISDSHGNVTIRLKKNLPMECLHCNSKKINNKIEGWCYVSTCGQYCYHIACVMELFLRNWARNTRGESFVVDSLALGSVDPRHRAVVAQGRAKGPTKFWKMVATVLKLVISALFGDPITFTATVVGNLLTN